MYETRQWRRTLGVLASLTMASVLVAGCAGADSSTTPTNPPSDENLFELENLDVGPGTTLPDVTLRMGIEPYADHSIHVIGMAQGWYDEAGISISPPPFGSKVEVDQVVPRLTQGDVDAVTWFAPSAMQVLDAAPDARFIAFHDIVVGRYLMANPDLGVTSVEELIDDGASFEEAMANAAGELKGRTLAIGGDASQAPYLNLILSYSDVSVDDIDIKSLDDNDQLALAKGKQVDFVAPNGLAQMAAILGLGWKPLVRLDDFINELGADHPSVRSSLGNTGVVVDKNFVAEQPETALRMASVMFRIIDQLQDDPDAAYSHLLPFLASIAGVTLTQEEISTVFAELDPMLNFEEQTEFWEPGGRYYYEDMYNAIIGDNISSGVLSGTITDSRQIILGEQVYDALRELKERYEEIAPGLEDVSDSAKKETANQAKHFYEARNYLDAYRFAQAALG